MTRTRRLLLVVDAPSLLHRNHHARSHTGLRDRQGRPIWALHGMLRQILESIDSFAPDAVLFGLDDRTVPQSWWGQMLWPLRNPRRGQVRR